MIVRNDNDWLTATLGGQVVLLSVRGQDVISLDEAGAQIWAVIEKPFTLDEICIEISKQFAVAPEACRADVKRVLELFEHHGAAHDDTSSVAPRSGNVPHKAPDRAGQTVAGPAKLLAMRAGGGQTTVAENLERAVQAGDVIANEDGSFQLAAPQIRGTNWITVNNGPPLGCDFLMGFLYRHAYAEAAVPHGCRACYKVKVVLTTLRELVAAWQLAKRIRCRSKWGIDLHNPYSPNVYAGYFYVSGTEAAHTVLKVVRELFEADPKLGPNIAMTIKRGCSGVRGHAWTFRPLRIHAGNGRRGGLSEAPVQGREK